MRFFESIKVVRRLPTFHDLTLAHSHNQVDPRDYAPPAVRTDVKFRDISPYNLLGRTLYATFAKCIRRRSLS